MKPLILVVDDDTGVRAVLRRWATLLGYEVLAAATADEALALLRTDNVAVAVCDIKMPGHDGLWLVDQIRHQCPATSIILATGIADVDPHVTLQPGVVGYLVKPFDQATLAAALEEAVEDYERRRRAVVPPQLALPAADVVEGTVVRRSRLRRLGAAS